MFKRYIKIIKKSPKLFAEQLTSDMYVLEEYFGAKRPEYDMINRGYIRNNFSKSIIRFIFR